MTSNQDAGGVYDQVEARPPAKAGVPTWLWLGCGGGCLGLVVIVGVLFVLGKRAVETMMDPELQWPKLERALPFEERPQDLEMMGMSMPFLPFEQFILMDEANDRMATIFVAKQDADTMFDNLMKEKPTGAVMGMGTLKDLEARTFTIQGVEVPAVIFSGIGGQDIGAEVGSGARINLHAAGQDGVLVELRKLGAKEPLTEAEVEDFFQYFLLW
ncbi:MAG: hypothetical protein WD226_12700 [Planctomycetota bacterium]